MPVGTRHLKPAPKVPGAGAGAGQSQPAPKVPGAGAGLRCRVPVPVPVKFWQKVPGADRHPAPAIRGMLEPLFSTFVG